MGKFKRFLACVLVAAVILSLTACKKEPEAEPAVSSLVLAMAPDKTVYEEGETFDSTGMVVDAVYTDEHVEKNVAFTVKQKRLLHPAQKP